VWTRQNPKRAAGRFGWTSFLALLICGPAWLIFADEPRRADDGAVNPLALVVPSVAVLFALILAPQLLALVRRPVVRADSYAMSVRPGVVRTLLLPWARIAELALLEVEEEEFLLVRCVPGLRGALRGAGDSPRWWDQAHLRYARRGLPAVAAYDLAVPMGEFAGAPADLLADLAACAPAQVVVVDNTTD
jgi:hypothetical protein